MNEKIKLLKRLIDHKIIDPNDFYCIDINSLNIKFQGKYSSDKVSKYTKFFKFGISISGYVEANRGLIWITLTE